MSASRRITKESKVRSAIRRAAPARPTESVCRACGTAAGRVTAVELGGGRSWCHACGEELHAPSLNEVLAALGYTTKPGSGIPHPGKKILRDGNVVHEGSADSTWTWLRQTGQIS